jgi:hypothetical protein
MRFFILGKKWDHFSGGLLMEGNRRKEIDRETFLFGWSCFSSLVKEVEKCSPISREKYSSVLSIVGLFARLHFSWPSGVISSQNLLRKKENKWSK